MRRAIPYVLLALLTLASGLAALGSSKSSPAGAYGMRPASSVPWGSISLGWQLGRFVPRAHNDAVAGSTKARLFLLSPDAVRYDLSPAGVRPVTILDWSQDGRYVLTLHSATAHSGLSSDVLTVRDLRTWSIVRRFAVADARLIDTKQIHVSTAAFFGLGHSRVAISTSTLTYGSYRTSSSYLFIADTSRSRVDFGPVFRSSDHSEVAYFWPQPSGQAILTEGSTVLTPTKSGWQRRQVGTDTCYASSGWWTPTKVLEQCSLTKDNNTQLFAFDLISGTRVPISPQPGFMFPDDQSGNRTWAFGYDDAWQVEGRTFVSALATCGPGWVEVVTGTTSRQVPNSGGHIAGVASGALLLSVVRGECFGGWALTRMDPITLRQRDLISGRTLPGKVDFLGSIERYHSLG